MGVETAIMTAAAMSLIGTGASIAQGQSAAKAQKTAQGEAMAAAQKQEKQSEEAMNAANRKSPDVSAILANAQNMSKQGVTGTMLTGPQGIDPNSIKLGKTSLLGG